MNKLVFGVVLTKESEAVEKFHVVAKDITEALAEAKKELEKEGKYNKDLIISAVMQDLDVSEIVNIDEEQEINSTGTIAFKHTCGEVIKVDDPEDEWELICPKCKEKISNTDLTFVFGYWRMSSKNSEQKEEKIRE